MPYSTIDKFLDKNLDASIAELAELCAVPSVAAQKRGVTQCADLVAAMFLKRDFTVEIMDTGGAPVVYAERKGKSDKTLIFYNHYDVQPEDPIDLWDSEPFKLAQKDGKLFARGISDDKGHLVSRLFALDAL
ncbi:MAG: M20/M25/M40 family metallo-hydrolase, partial [Chloroflexota bacterium]